MLYYFISNINTQQQIFIIRYYSNSNIRKQLRRYPSTLYLVEYGINSVNIRRQGSYKRTTKELF